MRLILVVLCGLMLAGCVSPAERATRMAQLHAQWDAKDDSVCKAYGAQPGTDAYVHCRVAQQQLRMSQAQADDANMAARMRPQINCTTTATALGTRSTTCN